MKYECEGQISLFDTLSETDLKPGDWVGATYLGEELTFNDITQIVGQMIIIDKSTQNRTGYKVVLVEKIITHPENGTKSFIYYDGAKQRGMINEVYFDGRMTYRERAWRLK